MGRIPLVRLTDQRGAIVINGKSAVKGDPTFETPAIAFVVGTMEKVEVFFNEHGALTVK